MTSDYTERRIFKAAVDYFGFDPQVDVVIEECSELQKALIKLRRAKRRQVWGALDLEQTAIERHVIKCQENVVEEAADVWIMLGQLEFMVPGEYVKTREKKLHKFVRELEGRGVEI